MGSESISIIDDAVVSDKYDCKKSMANIIIGGFIGLSLGFSVGFFLDLLEKNDKKSKK